MAKEQPGADGAQLGGRGPCARLSREVLDRLAAPDVRDTILRGALEVAGLTEVPEDPGSFGSFACGPLRDAVALMLGSEEAAAVIADLSPAFAAEGSVSATSGVRRRKRASLAAPSEGAPIVLVASADAAMVDTLTSRLKERAKVIAAFDVFALLSAAAQPSSAPITVLLHDDMPGMRPSTLSTLGRVLPSGTRVIVWGQAELQPERRDTALTVEWVHLGPVEDVDAVADMCIAMWPSSLEDEDALPVDGRRVVLAHDNAVWRARVSRILADAGYAVVSAPDGFMALEHCIEQAPSAVIAAFAMDTIDGPQLASLLCTRFGEDAPPVLLVADGPLPEPPPGARAVILNDNVEDDLIPELAAWIGTG